MNNSLLKFLQFDVSVNVALISIFIFIFFYRKIPAKEKAVAWVIFIYGLTETTAGALAYTNQYNLWFYNIMLIPQLMVVSYALLSGMKRELTVKILTAGIAFFIILHALNLAYYQTLDQFANLTFIPSNILLAVIAYYYLRRNLEAIEIKPFDSLITWLAVATLIDNAASMPILTVIGWSEYISTEEMLSLIRIVNWLYSFWYMLIIFGLIWTTTSLRSVFYSR